jgi:hypothetical protein
MYQRIAENFPSIPSKVDERYTLKMAVQSMVESGMKKRTGATKP